ncbi:hypothetical protein [Streptomyces zhihengii]|uniref:Uncharacterized protein n=1 Tax=Streptomyces zhihengii TaxID=1818004 RepID=A0ABS2UY72_9ACTN|nr:hypothetical protein [Streptomyces zhihengii]MBM9622507.1 hypothetical protein [Streptomyces zhihengii]
MATRLPALWSTAYGSTPHRLRRALARAALRVARFARELALADHTPGGGY